MERVRRYSARGELDQSGLERRQAVAIVCEATTGRGRHRPSVARVRSGASTFRDLLVIALIGAPSAVNGYGLAVWLADGSVIVVIVTCGVVELLMRPFRERLLPDRDEPGIERSG